MSTLSRFRRCETLLTALFLITTAGTAQRPDPTDPAHPFNSPAAVASAATPARFERWRAEIRKSLHVPSPLPALTPRTFSTFRPMDGVIARRVTYGTQFGMRIPAIVYMPEHPSSKLPAIIVVGGHGGDKTSWYSIYTGLLYAKAGAIVLTYDPIGEDERNADHRSDARAHDAVIPGPDAAIMTGGLMITDILQAVSYVGTLPNVDPTRIALAGYSMGSLQGALAAAIDPRIRTLILSGGGDLDGNGGAWDSENKPMCQAAPYTSLNSLPDKGAILYALHQRAGKTLILNGRLDALIGKPHYFESFFNDLADRSTAIGGPTSNRIEASFILNVGHRPSFVTLEAATWLNTQLHFPNWSGISLATLGETHIAEWATKNNVHINTGYADEVREGGIRALGTDFPGIPRDQLQVVPLGEWTQHKDLYTWQSWQIHVLQTEGLPLSLAVAPPTPR